MIFAVRQVSSLIVPMSLFMLLALVVTACGNTDNGADDTDNNGDATANDDEPNVSDDAADPIEVSADELDIIDEWEEAGVPRFQDGQVLDFDAHSSEIENGGTLLLDGLAASEDEVISFYRGALAELGWDERRVDQREMTAESDVASLLVTVNVYDEETLIMMILTDRLAES